MPGRSGRRWCSLIQLPFRSRGRHRGDSGDPRGVCDAVLVGEHQNKPEFPPTLMGRLLLDAGVTPWITLSCRDRNRVVLEQELRGLRASASAR